MDRQEWIAACAEYEEEAVKSPEIRPCTCGIGGYYVVYDWAVNERKRPMWHRLTMEHAIALRDGR